MCTFANSENSSYFVVLYNIKKKKQCILVKIYKEIECIF